MLATRVQLQKSYERALFNALTLHQYVESLLKTYITTSCRERDESDIDRLGLYQLNQNFSKLCKNRELHEQIESVRNTRNKLAHSAFFQNYLEKLRNNMNMDNDDLHKEELHKKACEMVSHADDVDSIVTQLHRELQSLQD